MTQALGESHARQQVSRGVLRLRRRHAPHQQRHGDVFERGDSGSRWWNW